MSGDIERIIVKFLTNEANEYELEKLAEWLKVKDNALFFDQFVKINYAFDMNMNEFNSESVKIALKHRKRQDKNPFYKFKIRKVFRYAAVVAIAIGLGYFFRDALFERDNSIQIVDTPKTPTNLSPGTHKAILTLEDGSSVFLEKGDAVQTKDANSNGEEIVYQANQQLAKEIVYNTLTIPRGAQYVVALSDGTRVWLNSETQLKYPVSFVEGKTRQVELVHGEAYFEVSPSTKHKGSKFVVFNQYQEVEVLGTEFNIKAYKDESEISTTLVEGKVAIRLDEEKEQYLKPNEQSIWSPDTKALSVNTIDVYNEVSWRFGVFSFDNKPLSEIMKILSRWYDVDIIFMNKDIKNIGFVGALRKDKNLEDIMLNLKNLDIIKDYEIKSNTVLLK